MPRSSEEAATAPALAAGPLELDAPAPRRNPWWIPPFLGRVPAITDAQLRLLGLVSLALFFEAYDMSMLTAALKHIAHGLSIDEQQMGGYLGVIRLGALPAFLLIPLADRVGRRRLFLVSIIGLSVFTFLTALTQNAWQFVAVQMFSRVFMVMALSCAVVIVTEEFPAEHRGWGIGMMGALGACGVGFGALLFSLVNVLPFGWRALYGVGVLPLLLMPLFRRGVKETARFERGRDRALAENAPALSAFRAWLTPLQGLVREHPGRALGIGLVALLVATGTAPVFQFTGYFVQTVHGWEPWQYSTMVIMGGGIGIVGNVAAGRLGDRHGRRRVGFAMMLLFPFFVLGFYQGPGWLLPISWVLFVFCQTAQQTITRAVSTELFPTAYRGTASGWNALVETVGAALGLALVGLGTAVPGRIAVMTSLIAFVVVVGGFFLMLLPETGSRELEAISGEEVA
jgi:MFS family permease